MLFNFRRFKDTIGLVVLQGRNSFIVSTDGYNYKCLPVTTERWKYTFDISSFLQNSRETATTCGCTISHTMSSRRSQQCGSRCSSNSRGTRLHQFGGGFHWLSNLECCPKQWYRTSSLSVKLLWLWKCALKMAISPVEWCWILIDWVVSCVNFPYLDFLISQEFSPHPGGETEALRRLDDSLADQVTVTYLCRATPGAITFVGVFRVGLTQLCTRRIFYLGYFE